jgi:hypothetical protein
MTPTPGLLWLTLGALLFFVFRPLPSYPCQCGHIGSVAEEYPEAAAVFDGEVLQISRLEPWWRHARRELVLGLYWRLGRQPPSWLSKEVDQLVESGRYGFLIRFRVIAYWKGVTGRETEVLTGFGQGDCGYPFEVGREYRVWAFLSDGEHRLHKRSGLYTHRCTRTMEGFSARLEELPPDKVQYPPE